MITSRDYITNEYKTLLQNSILVLSIVLFAITSINIILVTIAPIWQIKLCLLPSVIASIVSAWLLYKVVRHLTNHRGQLVIIEWIGSYLCLLIGIIPIMFFVYLNLGWELLASYGKMAVFIYWSYENVVLPIMFALLVSLIFWTLTVQLYKKSYTTYLCVNKKKEIYEE